ncbi:gamma-glutamyltransferase [Halobacillus halophilus]|uniref:gamma-glutamyltransferase n=1 Tax=Halobacillus halophilus TaxID=1570 RepID=UPI001CD58906|nr:gamma-glutamyltransferase [Halobacillus halophilus]MCA1010515.1 gamma-glutamyltransferase [Halobacillus halophilus]
MNKKILSILIMMTIVTAAAVTYFISNQGMEKAPGYGIQSSPATGTTEAYGVSSSHPLAVKAGMEVLEKGGNAVDAAVAVSYALGVVEPYGSGIGGGGAMLIHPADEEKEPVIYQYRETAPISGANPSNKFGVPGLVKGLEAAHSDFGSMDMEKLLEPSILLAEDGFKVDEHLTQRLEDNAHRMPVKKLDHFFPGGEPIQPNETLKQKELAKTLRSIQSEGSGAFYSGDIADKLADDVKELTKSDLSNYTVMKSAPVKGEFAGYDIYSAPPPLSGVTLIQSLKASEMVDLKEAEGSQADYIHMIGEISKRTYDDRVENIGDPLYTDQSYEELTEYDYVEDLVSSVDMDELSDDYETSDTVAEEDHVSTTHYVVVDADGNMVSVTNTLSAYFGSGEEVGGFFLNDQLKNFSPDDSSINGMEAGKRPRSFTSPTIMTNGERKIGIGSPGGERIPMMLTEVLTKHVMFGEPLQDAIASPRFYIEDDDVYVEKDIDNEVKEELEERDYDVHLEVSPTYYGGVQALVVDQEENSVYGGSDPRRAGAWQVKEYQGKD